MLEPQHNGGGLELPFWYQNCHDYNGNLCKVPVKKYFADC